ncbi:MAG: glutamyl-tRNA reductase [Ignavibacteriales bacterium]|nr:glutamyl-tRNA reductase [Ignavibacteriota bacterium]MCB9247890.1 glutamyl-tRNA reductase [Ignavibacteriales bacterium]
MNLIGISINHRTSPIELREAVHFSVEEQQQFIAILKSNILKEGFVLSTCNRTEIFGIPKSNHISTKNLFDELIKFKNIDTLKIEHIENFNSQNSIKHIAKVASGIDSLIIGDSQILSQCKESFRLSVNQDFSDTITRKIFDISVRIGKRAIKETLISQGAVTVSYAAIQVIEKIFSNLDKKEALIIGAGETSELAAIHLNARSIGKITITNRTADKAGKLAKKVGGSTIEFSEFKQHLHKFDIIITATSAKDFLVSYDDIKSAIHKRKGTPIFIMDIAIPRDIDPKVKKIDNVFYNDIDSLNIIVDQNLQKRKHEIPKVEQIIEEEIEGFYNWYNTLGIVPTIKSLRSFFEEIEMDELSKIKNKVSDDDYIKLEEMAKRLVGRILHNPTIKLRALAESGEESKAEDHTSALKYLFDLDNLPKNGKN